jgi:tetratricopeptide (TPR) repeat protein
VFDLCDAVEEFLENNQPLISQKRLEISYIKLYISRGTAFGLEKKYDLAIKEYLRITKKYPPHVRFANYEHVHFNIASLYIELQDTALAVITLHSLSPT